MIIGVNKDSHKPMVLFFSPDYVQDSTFTTIIIIFGQAQSNSADPDQTASQGAV